MTAEQHLAYCKEQAAIERAAAEATKLPMVRARHLSSAEAWDKQAARAESVAAHRDRLAASFKDPTLYS